jgi:hypothetical protein
MCWDERLFVAVVQKYGSDVLFFVFLPFFLQGTAKN